MNKAAAAAVVVVNTVNHDGHQQQQNVSSNSDKLNRVNLITSSPTSSTFLEKAEEGNLVVKELSRQEPSSRLEKLNSPPLEVF